LVEVDGEKIGWKETCRLYKNFEGIWPTEGKNGDGMVPKTMGIGDRIFLERVCKKSEFI
jgi:hypothetical protein